MSNKKYNQNIDLKGNQLINSSLEQRLADPATPFHGQLWLNETMNTLSFRSNGTTYAVPSAAGGGAITEADTTQLANRIQELGDFSQTWNNAGTLDFKVTSGQFKVNTTNSILPGHSSDIKTTLNTVKLEATNATSVGGTSVVSSEGGKVRLVVTKAGLGTRGFEVQAGSVGAALGAPQTHVITQDLITATASVGQVLTLMGTSGECEWQAAGGGVSGFNDLWDSSTTGAGSSGGFVDIGAIRIQWGKVSANNAGTTVVTLPAPFANAAYVITANTQLSPMASTSRSVVLSSILANSFGVAAVTGADNYSDETVMWQAIGLKA